ncbi:MAG: chemotaxis protein CheX [bacterium]|nr:chemotaxis protein CheX [bacterium]
MELTHIDARFITLFLESYQEVFGRVFDCDVCRGTVSVMSSQNGHSTVAVLTGVIGNCHTGMVVFRMKEETARRMVGYLDPTMAAFRESMFEGLGEVFNIVSGNAVQHLAKNKIDLSITTPSVVAGNPLALHLLNQSAYSVSMLSPLGEVGIDIAIKRL